MLVRGGAWNNTHDNARCAYRNNNHPDNRNTNLGPRKLRTMRRRKNSARKVRSVAPAARHGPPRVRAGAEGT